MKITLDIPDWAADGRGLYLITRDEMVARRAPGSDEWLVKMSRCSQCGACCKEHPEVGAYFPLDENGSCCHLKEDGKDRWVCSAGLGKVVACVVGEPEGAEWVRFKCTVGYRK